MKNNVSLIITMKGRSDKAARQIPSWCGRVCAHASADPPRIISRWNGNTVYYYCFVNNSGAKTIRTVQVSLTIESISLRGVLFNPRRRQNVSMPVTLLTIILRLFNVARFAAGAERLFY